MTDLIVNFILFQYINGILKEFRCHHVQIKAVFNYLFSTKEAQFTGTVFNQKFEIKGLGYRLLSPTNLRFYLQKGWSVEYKIRKFQRESSVIY